MPDLDQSDIDPEHRLTQTEEVCPECWLVKNKYLTVCANCDGPSVHDRKESN